ncbi:ParA family protein [Sphingorhabdus sp. Alg239-R122]|uniref:ParA family protein n=1 Tax=Sphingorhabdus sp. Alg239-R122 TaxID=2305989 RepID=UPI0013DC6BED|nr:ParA family protein [Sphingorhabdus sp. Alg239-R122]
MAIIAVYNVKSGTGKTAMAVNLGWCSAQISERRTLLWDLDPQEAANEIIGAGLTVKEEASASFSAKRIDPAKLVRTSTVRGLDLLATDASLDNLDQIKFDMNRKKRLHKLVDALEESYAHIILDCPPALTEMGTQILRSAQVIIVPIIPSPRSEQILSEVQDYLGAQTGRHPPLLPVHSIADTSRDQHRGALERSPKWPVIPMSSALQKMSFYKKPVMEFEESDPASLAYRSLWNGIEKKLAG